MKALGFPLRNVLRIDRWRRPEEIGWVSESGLVKQEEGFTFTETEQGVRIELRIAYEPPASVIGTAIARRIDPMVRARLQHALERIRDLLERKVSPMQLTREASAIVSKASIGMLALRSGRLPLVNPAVFSFAGGSLWMTTSRYAAKTAIAKRDPRAAFL